MKNLIEVKNLKKYYGKKEAVKGPEVKDVEYEPPTKLPALKSKDVKKLELDAITKYSSIKLASLDDFVLT